MGASLTLGVAMKLGERNESERLEAMVLVRPAWVDEARPANLDIVAKLGHWIEGEGLEAAAGRLQDEPMYQRLLAENPNCAASIAGVLSRPHAQEHATVLYRMVEDRPLTDLAALRALDVPALVLSNDADPLHPVAVADEWAKQLPKAERCHLAPRYLEPDAHQRQLNAVVQSFLDRNFKRPS